jgi:hypothetical protein
MSPVASVKANTTEGDSMNNASINIDELQAYLLYEAGTDGDHLSFDGKKGLDVPPEALADLGSEITVSFWQFGSSNRGQTIMLSANKGTKSILKLRFPMADGSVIWNAAGDALNLKPPLSHIEGRWNHWAFTKNADTGRISIYVNGILLNTKENAIKKLEAPDSVVIGTDIDGANGYKGLVKDFMIYGKELKPLEIYEVYKGGRAAEPNPADESNLVGINGEIQPLSCPHGTLAADCLAVKYVINLFTRCHLSIAPLLLH